MLPAVTDIMNEVFVLNGRIDAAARDVDDLIDIWGEELFDHSHMDNRLYQEKMRIRNENIMKLKVKIDEIQNLGCIVKNIDEGIIDFPGRRNYRTVHLCWKYGESEIKHWHSADEEDTKRRVLEEVVA